MRNASRIYQEFTASIKVTRLAVCYLQHKICVTPLFNFISRNRQINIDNEEVFCIDLLQMGISKMLFTEIKA